MKKKIRITAVLMFAMLIFGCNKDDKSTPSNSGSSNGGGGGGGGGGSTTGTVNITASWSVTPPWNACGTPFTVVIGLGYNSNDVANESYFASNSFYYSSATYTNNSLAAGIYYYGAKKTFNSSTCGTGQGIPPTIKKSGSFTIIAGQTTTVSGVSLN